MFWENFVSLCEKVGKSPNHVCKELGFSNASSTHWKNGKQPRKKTLEAIADYFDIPVDDLLSSSKKETTTPPEQPLSLRDKYILSRFEGMSDDEVSKALDYLEKLKNQDT